MSVQVRAGSDWTQSTFVWKSIKRALLLQVPEAVTGTTPRAGDGPGRGGQHVHVQERGRIWYVVTTGLWQRTVVYTRWPPRGQLSQFGEKRLSCPHSSLGNPCPEGRLVCSLRNVIPSRGPQRAGHMQERKKNQNTAVSTPNKKQRGPSPRRSKDRGWALESRSKWP